jgi:NADH-quinone oxidoreductase subunit K
VISVSHYLAVGAILFCLGLIGFLTRRNLIVMFLSAELMLQGVAINFVAFSRHHGNLHGQVFTLFIIAVAACEAGIALALFLVLYRRKHSLDVSLWQALREPGLPVIGDLEPLPAEPKEDPLPHLATAGAIPARGEEPTHV